MYAHMRSRTEITRTIPPIVSLSGILITDDEEKAARFLDYFTPQCGIVADDGQDVDIEGAPSLDFANSLFSAAIVAKIIGEMKSSAPGPDGIPASMFKLTRNSSAKLLSEVFVDFLVTGLVPPEWGKATVIPIYKGKGLRNDPKNYRPISLTCVSSKIFERCLLKYLIPILVNTGAIPTHQYGTIPGRSSTAQLLISQHQMSTWLDEDVPFDVLYFDYSKAFDCVDREILFNKLYGLPIHRSVYKVIRALFTNRSHQIRVGKSLSRSEKLTTGVVQGTVLSSLLYVIYTSEVPSPPYPGRTYTFVDDTKWIAPVGTFRQGFDIQVGCNELVEWCDHNRILISSEKSCVMHVGYDNPLFSYKLKHDQTIPEVSLQNDLGVTFDNTLSFSSHCQRVSTKAIGISSIIGRSFAKCDHTTLYHAFRTYVVPLLMYASPVWSPYKISDIKILERPQRLFTKHMSGMYAIDYSDRLRALGTHSMEWRRVEADLIFCYKILGGAIYFDSHVPFLAYKTDRTRGHSRSIRIPFTRNNTYYHSFPARVARVWNSLPEDMVQVGSLKAFRRRLAAYDLSEHLSVYRF